MPAVTLVENHDEVYPIWREAGFRDRTVVHIDAHHDMWWASDDRSVTIASFLCPALKEGILKEVFWVAPDGTWTSRKGRRALLRHLASIARVYPDSSGPADAGSESVSIRVLGKRVTACSLASLPALEDAVLLDVDTDFLVIPRVSHGGLDEHSETPWCWPDELLRRIETARVRSDFVTICYSVEGGYTPVGWKYLGDELAARFGGAEPTLFAAWICFGKAR